MMIHLLNHSSFNNSGIKLILNNTRAGQKQVQENPAECGMYVSIGVCMGLILMQNPLGTQRSISKITTKHLRAFRDTF